MKRTFFDFARLGRLGQTYRLGLLLNHQGACKNLAQGLARPACLALRVGSVVLLLFSFLDWANWKLFDSLALRDGWDHCVIMPDSGHLLCKGRSFMHDLFWVWQ